MGLAQSLRGSLCPQLHQDQKSPLSTVINQPPTDLGTNSDFEIVKSVNGNPGILKVRFSDYV